MPPLTKTAEIKRITRHINANLLMLEEFAANSHDSDDYNDGIQVLRDEITELLKLLKQMPSGLIARIITKRRKRRNKSRMKKKMRKQFKLKSKNQETEEIAFALENTKISKENKPTKQYNNHNLLKKRTDAERFVQTFDLLEDLHSARSWDSQATQEFLSKILTLRSIWLKELRSAITEKAQHRSHEEQWSNVIFGTITSYCNLDRKLKDFIRLRRTWDSYISKDRNADSMPSGWILPHMETNPLWKPYQIE